MERVAVIGNKQTVQIFKSLGVEVFAVFSGEEMELFKNILKRDFKIIFVTDDVYKICKDEIKKHIYDSKVMITVIPNAKTENSFGIAELRQATIEAISTDILGE